MTGEKILIVDDEEGMRKLLGRVLAKNGYESVSAANGNEALRLVESEQFDLVITDYNMPKLTGSSLCRRLRQHPHYTHTPIVLMTACIDDLDLARLSSDLRLTEIWSKPLSMTSLVDRVTAVLAVDCDLVTQGIERR